MGSSTFLELIWIQCWQIGLAALIVLGLIRVMARNQPHMAHALLLILIVKCLIPPIWSSHAGIFSWIATMSQAEQVDANSFADRQITAPGTSTWTVMWNQLSTGVLAIGPEKAANASAKQPGNSQSAIFAMKYGAPSLWFVIFWVATGASMIIWSWVRYMRFCRSIEESSVEPASDVADMAIRVAGKLRLKRKFRVRVVEAPIGPVVFGIWTPTILLPRVIEKEMSPRQQELLLAHELVHIRRNDIVWAGLQAVANAIWWFHPLVWVASRSMSYECERCCDEETVAGMKCEPIEYAKCLLYVLERKHQLRVTPALPGVRPVQVTMNRLERIMNMKHGCFSKYRPGVWMAALLCGVAILPGAALVTAQSPKPAITQPNLAQPPNTTGTEVDENEGTDTAKKEETFEIRYAVGPLLQRMVDDKYSHDRDEAIRSLACHLSLVEFPPNPKPDIEDTYPAPIAIPAPAPKSKEESIAWFNALKKKYRIEGDALVVQTTHAHHEQIKSEIEKRNKQGFVLSVIRVQIIKSRSPVDPNGIDWKPFPAMTTGNTNLTHAIGSSYAILDTQQKQEFEGLVKQDRTIHVSYTPRLTSLNGNTSCIKSGNQIGFVSGVTLSDEPKNDVLETGYELQCTVEEADSGKVEIKTFWKFVELIEMTKSNSKTRDGKEIEIELPVLSEFEQTFELTMELGSHLLVRAPQTFSTEPGQGQVDQYLTLMLEVQHASEPTRPSVSVLNSSRPKPALAGTVSSDLGVIGRMILKE